jgi:hypothetical protein
VSHCRNVTNFGCNVIEALVLGVLSCECRSTDRGSPEFLLENAVAEGAVPLSDTDAAVGPRPLRTT